MDIKSQRILVTGASGGIGQALCRALAQCGARLCMIDRRKGGDATLAWELNTFVTEVLHLEADISRAEERERALRQVMQAWGGVDILVNLAGVLDFTRFDEQDPAMIQRILQVNVEAPMQLTRGVLPQMVARGRGRIVNIGSMFGSIGFPCFAAYSASKFALRGFSQALRRELAESGVGVTYVAPRAVKTAFNPPVVHKMAELGMMRMDEAEWVARKIVHAVERERDEVYLGFPESLFARINAVLPGLVGRALVKQVPALSAFSRQKTSMRNPLST